MMVQAMLSFLWTLKYILLCSFGKLFYVLFQASIYIFSIKKKKKSL